MNYLEAESLIGVRERVEINGYFQGSLKKVLANKRPKGVLVVN